MDKKLKVGDKIFFIYDGKFQVDSVKEVILVDGKQLITPKYWDWIAISEEELLDETDDRVKDILCLSKDKYIKLSEARSWLQSHLLDYYESDEWSSFNNEEAIRDFCKAMIY